METDLYIPADTEWFILNKTISKRENLSDRCEILWFSKSIKNGTTYQNVNDMCSEKFSSVIVNILNDLLHFFIDRKKSKEEKSRTIAVGPAKIQMWHDVNRSECGVRESNLWGGNGGGGGWVMYAMNTGTPEGRRRRCADCGVACGGLLVSPIDRLPRTLKYGARKTVRAMQLTRPLLPPTLSLFQPPYYSQRCDHHRIPLAQPSLSNYN